MGIDFSKFSVVSNGRQYYIDLYESYVALGQYQYVVHVYEKNKIKLFNLELYKYKKLFTYKTGWSKYEQWKGEYVRLAKAAIKEYESSLISEIVQQELDDKGIKEFEEWDGVVR